jgi:hypothetical protein
MISAGVHNAWIALFTGMLLYTAARGRVHGSV